MTDPPVGGPDLPQERRLVTAIPGPRSQRADRPPRGGGGPGRRHHAAGVRERRRRRRARRRRRQLAHRHRLGHRRRQRRQRRRRGRGAACRRRSPRSPTPASWSRPTRATSRSARRSTGSRPATTTKRSALFNSGAEAVENAVKIARAATGRTAVVVFDHGYHGRTNLTMALTAKNMPYKHGFGPFAPEVYRVPMAYPFRWPTGPERCGEEAAARGDRPDRRRRSAPRTSRAVVVEPIQGEGGFIVPGAGLPAGAGRVLPGQRDRVRGRRDPDRLRPHRRDGSPASTRASSPTSSPPRRASPAGLPLAAVTGRAELMDAVHVGGLGGTYGGNPVACAAALGAIETIEAQDLSARPPGSATIMLPACATCRARPRDRRRARPRRDGRRRAGAARHASSPTRRGRVRRRGGLPRRGRGRPHRRHLRQRAALPAAARHRRRPAARGPRRPREGLRHLESPATSRPLAESHARPDRAGRVAASGGGARRRRPRGSRTSARVEERQRRNASGPSTPTPDQLSGRRAARGRRPGSSRSATRRPARRTRAIDHSLSTTW